MEKRLKQLEKEREESKQKELEEKEEYKQLYESTKQQLEQKDTEMQTTLKKTALEMAAAKANANDPSDINAFVNLDDLELEDGKVTNAEAVIKSLAEQKPYLFGDTGKRNVGSGANPTGDDATGRIWPWSEVKQKRKNQAWYETHKEELDKARQEGRIDYSK